MSCWPTLRSPPRPCSAGATRTASTTCPRALVLRAELDLTAMRSFVTEHLRRQYAPAAMTVLPKLDDAKLMTVANRIKLISDIG